MSVRNLDALFRPRAIALIGASRRPHSPGLVTFENLLTGGFGGPIFPVNPKYESILGVRCHPAVGSLPEVPDLAVLCTPPATIPPLIAELGARGTKGAVVITAGFGELGNEAGKALERAMLEAARPHLLRIVGPNCLGILSTPSGLNASFAPGNALKGGVALVAQSGAMVAAMLDWASARGLGFSHLVSLGDMADVDFGDMLDYLATDPATSAVLLYIEAVTAPRKFLSAARAAARLKPVIAIKSGRHEAAARAAASHTGALAGTDAVYDAVFRRAGILRVYELKELFDAAETLAAPMNVSGDDLIIVTNGGGAGVLATDALMASGGRLAELSPETISRLDGVLPRTWSRANPVDIIGDAPPERYAKALEILLDAPGSAALLIINCPTAVASSVEAAEAVTRICKGKGRAVLANWLGVQTAAAARAALKDAGIPAYDTPENAARGFMHLARYRKGQELLLEAPPTLATEFSPDEKRARAIIARALDAGESWLNPEALQDLLACYRIPIARARTASTPDEAQRIQEEFAGPVALKILSRDIVHKSDVGGVMLDLATPASVKAGAQSMLERIAERAPQARVDGFVVQEMVRMPGSHELIAGMTVDRQFGPVILFGHGGTATEVLADRALALPPLNLALARELMAGTRIYRLLKGYRDHPPAALDAIALTLVKLSQLAADLDEVVEVDLNPLLANPHRVVAVDARIRIERGSGTLRRGSRLSIRPYPRELESQETTDVGELTLRPVKPEDAPRVAALVSELAPENGRLPFRVLKGGLKPMLARLTQIDYDREMVFVLQEREPSGRLLGLASLAADPDNIRAEFAVLVRSGWRGRGLGLLLLERLIGYARSRGLQELAGDVLASNHAMIALCERFGFSLSPAEAGILRASLRLNEVKGIA